MLGFDGCDTEGRRLGGGHAQRCDPAGAAEVVGSSMVFELIPGALDLDQAGALGGRGRPRGRSHALVNHRLDGEHPLDLLHRDRHAL